MSRITTLSATLLSLILVLVLSSCTSSRQRATTIPPSGPFQNAMVLQDGHTKRSSSSDPKGGNFDAFPVEPGSTVVLLDEKRAGRVNHIYCTYINNDPAIQKQFLRNMILRAYWDGETTPSIECPLGDFFGISNGEPRRLEALGLNVCAGFNYDPMSWGMSCFFTMPFAEGARIEVTNESPFGFGLYFHVNYETYDEVPEWLDRVGRFHAQFRREMTKGIEGDQENHNRTSNLTGDENYTILEAEGNGALAGYILSVDNVVGGWYGEGDDMIFIDGATWPPTLLGTGSEEIFGGGACPNNEYMTPYGGFHLVEKKGGRDFQGKNGMYRFYTADPIRFHESIRVTIEHGHANNLSNDYSSVAYWYQEEPHAAFPPLPSPRDRLPLQ